jgi:hypothetical protein
MTCIICHFATELDDVVVAGGRASCICLRCYARETATGRPMPTALQRGLRQALGAPVAAVAEGRL